MDTDFLRVFFIERPLLKFPSDRPLLLEEEQSDASAFSSSPSLLRPPREFSDSKDADFLINMAGKEETCLALSLAPVEMVRVASLALAVWSCSTLFRLAATCSSSSHMLAQLGGEDVWRAVVEQPLMLFGSAGRECIRFSGEKT